MCLSVIFEKQQQNYLKFKKVLYYWVIKCSGRLFLFLSALEGFFIIIIISILRNAGLNLLNSEYKRKRYVAGSIHF